MGDRNAQERGGSDGCSQVRYFRIAVRAYLQHVGFTGVTAESEGPGV